MYFHVAILDEQSAFDVGDVPVRDERFDINPSLWTLHALELVLGMSSQVLQWSFKIIKSSESSECLCIRRLAGVKR